MTRQCPPPRRRNRLTTDERLLLSTLGIAFAGLLLTYLEPNQLRIGMIALWAVAFLLLRSEVRRMKRALARQRAQADRDALTHLKNRRVFDERLAEEWGRAGRYGTPLSLLLVDIDHFKQLNDTLGHLAGDAYLRRLAQVLQLSARTSDLVARYGGEEFALILPSTDATEAMAAAHRLLAAVRGGPWPGRAITVSIGVATVGPLMRQATDLVEAADGALYQVKAQGRNGALASTAPGTPIPTPLQSASAAR
jgi:diguanylate cyclase (GGDEF)-like protein